MIVGLLFSHADGEPFNLMIENPFGQIKGGLFGTHINQHSGLFEFGFGDHVIEEHKVHHRQAAHQQKYRSERTQKGYSIAFHGYQFEAFGEVSKGH